MQEEQTPPRPNSGPISRRLQQVRLVTSLSTEKLDNLENVINNQPWYNIFDLAIAVLCSLLFLIFWLLIGIPAVYLGKLVWNTLKLCWRGIANISVISIRGMENMGGPEISPIIIASCIVLIILLVTPVIVSVFH